ncbi:MAG: right-handed parallel beta-helix repeat-containing protein [Planctomycetota bacterium]
MRALLFLLLAAGVALPQGVQIAGDRRFPPGGHRLERPLRVVADGVTLDLAGAVLTGAGEGTAPDRFEGIGLIVEGRRRVRIRGGRLRGFRCAILVKDCEDVVVEGVDVSGNFRQRLRSTPEREAPSDWLWPHHNDAQEWRRNYGAGICLENCRKCVVRECVGRRQQNGLILDRSTECQVYDNDFSFNSGWGIALWRSSRNVISHNSCDWCVRGYSHGVYARGQDSAGILVFEQCRENVFAFNSATHGGDGFFLYAGHETLKRTGEGGCNSNVILGNDFSHAVANGIEATFSRGNLFEDNRCEDCNYGIWGGYSYESRFEGNRCRANSLAGIAIEHGMDNQILGNRIDRNPKGVWLWWDEDQDLLASKFGRTHPCRSEGYVLVGNVFGGNDTDVFLQDTSRVAFGGDVPKSLVRQGACEGLRGGAAYPREPPRLFEDEGQRDARLPRGHPRGRRYIMIGEWGPLDPKECAVFPHHVVGWGACAFHVLGPERAYEIKGLAQGLTVEKGARTFRVKGGDGGLTAFRGEVHTGGKVFAITGLLLTAKWRVRHWQWTEDPRKSGAWKRGAPLADVRSDSLALTWRHRGPDGVAADRFATRAETKMRLPAGRYEIRTLSDDGVRVLIDGRVVQEDWTWHAPKENRTVVELEAGEHEIVVEHFEIDGYAVLHFDLRPVK